MTPTLFLAILGLVGCTMVLAAVVLDYVRPTKFNGWTLKNSGTLK